MEKLSSVQLTIRILALVRLDAQRLYERIKYRAPEYLTIYSTKRTRDHFAAVFKNRYDEIAIEDLKFCDEKVISALDRFYSSVDKLRWYLYTTEDMPNKVDTKVHGVIKTLKKEYENLVQAIDEQRGIKSAPIQTQVEPEVKKVIEKKIEVNQVVFEEDVKPKVNPKVKIENVDIDEVEEVSNVQKELPKDMVNDFTLQFDFNADEDELIKKPVSSSESEEDDGVIKFDLDADLPSIENLEIKEK